MSIMLLSILALSVGFEMRDVVADASGKDNAAALTLEVQGSTLRVADNGAVQIEAGPDVYHLETRFSYPGASVGWNSLGKPETPCETAWKPALARLPDGSIEVRAAGTRYALERKLHVDRHRIVVTDTLINTGDQDVAIICRHQLTAQEPFRPLLLGGADQVGTSMTAPNPSVFVGQARSHLAWIAEDAVLRLQLSLATAENQVRMSAERFALKPGKQHTF